MTDHPFTLTPDLREALHELRATPKFNADRSHSYAGAPERIRILCEGDINDLLGQILDLPGSARPEAIHRIVRHALTRIDAYDSKERDRFCLYLEQILDVVGTDNSAGLLEKWRYGID